MDPIKNNLSYYIMNIDKIIKEEYEKIIKNMNGGQLPLKTQHILETKPKESYTNQINDSIKLISFSYDDSIVFGSFIYKSQPYPGDIDITEQIIECCDYNEASKKLVKAFQMIIKRIHGKKGVYLGDVKAGYDPIIFEFFYNRVYNNFDKNKVKEELIKLKNDGYIEDISDMLKLLNNKYFDEDNYLDLKDSIRKLYILRWNYNEIMKGYKILINNRKFTLQQGISQITLTKIDMWYPINGKYIEVTNAFQLFYQKQKGDNKIQLNYHSINLLEELKTEVKKYSSKHYLKPFKMAKRMYSIARILHDISTAKPIVELFRSELGLLNQINSEIETLILMLEKLPEPPMKQIKLQIDNFKTRLSSIINTNIDLNNLYKNINVITENALSKEKIIEILVKIHEYIKKIVSNDTLNYLKEEGLFPPPKKFLPTHEVFQA